MIYPSQSTKAAEIAQAFTAGASLVTFIAPPQWGKTGVALDLIRRMDVARDRVYMITGMSDRDWEAQTRARMPDGFRNRVFHRNKLARADFANMRDALIIIDECHYGSEVAQTMNRAVTHAGIWDIDYLRANNIKILSISATPANVLVDALTWGAEHHRTVIAATADTPEYVGFHTLISEKRVRSITTPDEFVPQLFETIKARWPQPRWHIVRATKTLMRKYGLEAEIRAHGYVCTHHNNKQRMKDIDALLAAPPPVHHFIFIKQFWRAAKTLDDTHIGVCIELTKDATQAAQGLGGRLLGFGKQRGAAAPVLYCHADTIKSYVAWLDAQCNYFMCKRYHSLSIKIKNGVVCKKKKSTLHTDEVANLEPVAPESSLPVYGAHGGGRTPPKKIGKVGADDVAGARLVTSLEVLDEAAFKVKFEVADIPEDARLLRRALPVRANISYTAHSAASRSNLVNYFTHPNWADDEYHISRIDGVFVVIRRDKAAIHACQRGDTVVAHNHLCELIMYRF